MNAVTQEIKTLIQGFCTQHLDDELSQFGIDLLMLIDKGSNLDVNRGNTNIWAASIIYVIARLNFCFDPVSDTPITIDLLCDYFKTVKSTSAKKATQIEKACHVSFLDQKFTKLRHTKLNEIYKTEEGFLFPASMMNGMAIEMVAITDEEQEEFDCLMKQQEKIEQMRLTEQKKQFQKRLEENRLIKINPDQLTLF